MFLIAMGIRLLISLNTLSSWLAHDICMAAVRPALISLHIALAVTSRHQVIPHSRAGANCHQNRQQEQQAL